MVVMNDWEKMYHNMNIGKMVNNHPVADRFADDWIFLLLSLLYFH
jgi:hypothetical protein